MSASELRANRSIFVSEDKRIERITIFGLMGFAFLEHEVEYFHSPDTVPQAELSMSIIEIRRCFTISRYMSFHRCIFQSTFHLLFVSTH